MPVRYEIDAAEGLVRVELAGAVTSSDVYAYYATLAADPAFRPGLSVLADARQVTAAPSFGELHGIATTTASSPPAGRPARVAVLVSSGWLFGIVRQFDVLVEAGNIRVTPFYDATAAGRWLASGHAVGDVPADATADMPSDIRPDSAADRPQSNRGPEDYPKPRAEGAGGWQERR
jgi:hypothetical protein